ncbi:hypothetical protein ACMZ9F_01430 [Gardnerella vaginalis]
MPDFHEIKGKNMPDFHEIEDIATVLDLAQLSLRNSKSWKHTSKLGTNLRKLEVYFQVERKLTKVGSLLPS